MTNKINWLIRYEKIILFRISPYWSLRFPSNNIFIFKSKNRLRLNRPKIRNPTNIFDKKYLSLDPDLNMS